MRRYLFLLTWLILTCLLSFNSYANEEINPRSTDIKLFLFLGGDSPENSEVLMKKIQAPCVSGVQVIYSWKELEPEKDHYDFSRIDKDLAYLNAP